ncbi:GNAT family N-acetyltransferase [Alkanindiges illinoisensis]|uniref:GNAT family N-acetyltransferase n=1 Tax=Alkanindiges illinoisensis TaxID=197183 RepID=UPI0004788ADE|nr:GNAT family N-acetyltransferase [Alkanindiges illinoisensis]
MPITVHAYSELNDENLRSQLSRLYETSPEFGDGDDAVQQLETAMQQGSLIYTAEFNQKIIGAVWVSGQDDTRLVHYVVVHPSNRGRGVAERLIEGVCDTEEQKGVKHFKPGCGAIHRCLSHLGKI